MAPRQTSSNRKKTVSSAKKKKTSPSVKKGEVIPNEILSHFPEEVQKQIKSGNMPNSLKGLISITKEERYKMPLPPPKMLAEYKHAAPKSVSSMIEQYELNQAHRRKMEEKMINHTLIDRVGLGLGFFILLGFVALVSQNITMTLIIIGGGILPIFRKQIARWLDKLRASKDEDD